MAEASVPLPVASLQPNRRGLLGLAAAGAASTLTPGHAQAERRDKHVAWLSEYFRLRNVYNTIDDLEDPEGDEIAWAELVRIRDMVQQTPAFTLEGSLAQLVLLADTSMIVEVAHEDVRPPLRTALALLQIETWVECV